MTCCAVFYVLSVTRNEKCYAQEFFAQLFDKPIFPDKFDFLKDRFEKKGVGQGADAA